MPKPIADPANVTPGYAGAQSSRFLAEAYGGFADDQQFVRHRRDGLQIRPERVELHPCRKTIDLTDRVQDVLEGKPCFSKCE